MFVKKRRTMFPKSTFEIIIDEEILYFKDVWAYMDSGIKGDVISSSDQLELEWDENFENVTTKNDDNLWISFKVPYIKHQMDGINKMQKLSDLHEDYKSRTERNQRRLDVAKEKLRKKQKKRVLELGAQQYRNNAAYRVKVKTLMQYALTAKILHHGFLLHHKYNAFKLGLYIACLAFNIASERGSRNCGDRLCFDLKV